MGRPWIKGLIGVGVVVVLAAGGWRMWMLMGGSADQMELPQFEEMGDGPRAPTSSGFGVEVGVTSLSDVLAYSDSRGMTCEDTSVRALMKKMREKKRQELKEKEASGEAADGESGASWLNKKSPKEKNPQVRLSCPDTSAETIGDRQRPEVDGRLLFVFDSPELPLRHVSYRRLQRDHQRAFADFSSATDAMVSLYGEPTDVMGEVTGEADADGFIFSKLRPVKREWNFADVHVKVTALNFGTRGVDILESVEVPLPVRSDAPTLNAEGRAER